MKRPLFKHLFLLSLLIATALPTTARSLAVDGILIKTTDETSIQGDVNNSGTVTIADVVMLYRAFMGLENELLTTSFDKVDVNGDGCVDMGDINLLIELILDPSLLNSAPKRQQVTLNSSSSADRFYIEDFSINAGDTLTVNIQLDNAKYYTAFQSDLYLPDGFMVVSNEFTLTSRDPEYATTDSKSQTDGAIRFLAYSSYLDSCSGNSGAVITFDLIAAKDFSGSATLALKNSLFVTADGTEYALADESCTISTSSTRSLGDVNGDNNIDAGDLNCIVKCISGQETPDTYGTHADLNGDNQVNAGDIDVIVGIITSKEQ